MDSYPQSRISMFHHNTYSAGRFCIQQGSQVCLDKNAGFRDTTLRDNFEVRLD